MPAGHPAGMGIVSLLQHVLFQILAVLDVQLLQHLGNIALDGVGGNIHVVADLLVRPPAGRQHGRSKLRGGQVVRHVVPRLRVMNSTPSGREPISDGDDALEILREILFEYRLQYTAQKPVMLPEALDQVIRPGQIPGGEQVDPGPLRLAQAHMLAALLVLSLCALLLSGCAASASDQQEESAPPAAEQTPPADQETSEEPTLEDLLG